MLKIIETPHRGPAREWTADDEADFCAKVIAANPKAGSLDPNATFNEIADWLASDLRSLEFIETGPTMLDAERLGRFLCDANYGETNISFAPLRAYLMFDGCVVVANPCEAEDQPQVIYQTLNKAAADYRWLRQWRDDQGNG